MPIYLIDKIKQKNNGTFKLVDASDVEGLENYVLSENSVSDIELELNQDTFVLSVTLKNKNGEIIGTQKNIDFPLEEFVVNGLYDNNKKSINLELKDGNIIEINLSGLIENLQEKINETNKLNADYLSDGNINKVFTLDEKNKLANLTNYSLPTATETTLGGVKAPQKTDAMTDSVGIDSNGFLYATHTKDYTVAENTEIESMFNL